MAYNPKNPPILLANGIGGARGVRHFAYTSTTDDVSQALAAGYFTNAAELGMRKGDALRFVDKDLNAHALQVGDIAESGAGTVNFPGTAPEAYPVEADPAGQIYLVAYVGGEQVRILAGDVPDAPPQAFAEYAADQAARPVGFGFFTDKDDDAIIFRRNDRLFLSAAATESAGTSDPADGCTFLNTGVGFYLERGATFLSVSDRGAIGGTFATRQSDQYTKLGYSVWTAGQVVSIGAKRGYFGRLYTATTAGTCGSTPLTHLSGTASDGGVTWQFDDYNYVVPIGMAAIAVADVADGHAAWAAYIEGLRTVNGGTIFGFEMPMKNQGSNVINGPYNLLPGGSTIGAWLPGGGDPATGVPANPSTAGIVFGKNGHTWNKGIVFGAEAITGTNGVTGTGIAVSMAKGHVIQWQVPAGAAGANLYSIVDDAVKYSALQFENDGIRVLARGNAIYSAESAAGALASNYLRFISFSTGSSPQIRPGGVDTNQDVLVQGVGTGGGSLRDGNGSYRVRTNTTGIGFNSVAPIGPPALGAAATDAATTMALTNLVRAALINYGLATA